MAGREAFTAQREQAEATHKINIRYDSALASVTPKNRILFGSQIFDIESIVNIYERNKDLVFMCREQIDG
jgi:SPP1 family predicted phage head-tail adaptor